MSVLCRVGILSAEELKKTSPSGRHSMCNNFFFFIHVYYELRNNWRIWEKTRKKLEKNSIKTRTRRGRFLLSCYLLVFSTILLFQYNTNSFLILHSHSFQGANTLKIISAPCSSVIYHHLPFFFYFFFLLIILREIERGKIFTVFTLKGMRMQD